MRPFLYAPGHIIFDWRTGADGVYFLVEGSVEMEQNVAEMLLANNEVPATAAQTDRTNVRICTLDKGKFFGYEELVGDEDYPFVVYKAGAFCSSHVLMASSVADIAETQPIAIARLQVVIRRAAIEQSATLRPTRAAYYEALEERKETIKSESQAAKALFR